MPDEQTEKNSWIKRTWRLFKNNPEQIGILINLLTLIAVIAGFWVAKNQLEEQVRQNAPKLASTSMCPILKPNSITNYTAKLHNFGNSPAYYDIGYKSVNVSIRISNYEECFLFDTRCGRPITTEWKTIPSQDEQKINFQFKTYDNPSFSFFVVVLDYKLESVRKVRGNLQDMEPIISELLGEKPVAPLPEFEIEEMKPVVKGTFHLLDCNYKYDKDTGLYLTEFQLKAKQQGLLDEYKKQIISESK